MRNAPTFLDEVRDPTYFSVDEEMLGRMEVPVRFTQGSDSPPLFGRAIDRLVELIPGATRDTVEDAAHVPQLQAPVRCVEVTTRAVQQAAT